jgi:hypothetical protein
MRDGVSGGSRGVCIPSGRGFWLSGPGLSEGLDAYATRRSSSTPSWSSSATSPSPVAPARALTEGLRLLRELADPSAPVTAAAPRDDGRIPRRPSQPAGLRMTEAADLTRPSPVRGWPRSPGKAGSSVDTDGRSARRYEIQLSDDACDHLEFLTGRQRATRLDSADRHLSHQPTVETRHRKRMEPGRAGFIAPWELRIGDMRLYYDTHETPRRLVLVVAVGVEIRSRLRIAGREYEP